jgi:hypothetical protein
MPVPVKPSHLKLELIFPTHKAHLINILIPILPHIPKLSKGIYDNAKDDV